MPDSIEQKCLVFDIETAPITAYVWDLKDQYVNLNQIVKDWYVLAWAAKWLGTPAKSVMYMDQRGRKNLPNDKKLVTAIWKLLDQADIVITQNGQKFDSQKLNARFIEHGLNPPSPYTHLDTYQILKRTAGFSSHSLEFLTGKLCTKYKKLSHPKFPGMRLWAECLKGNMAAWDEMKKYNIHDVLSTEELYLKVRAWTPQTAPKVFTQAPMDRVCTVCGSTRLKSYGVRPIGARLYQRLMCLKCGHWNKQIVVGPMRKAA